MSTNPFLGPAFQAHTGPDDRAALDYAMFTVWLCGKWRFLTSQMTTEAKEAAADAVERHWAVMDAEDAESTHDASRQELRWWLHG